MILFFLGTQTRLLAAIIVQDTTQNLEVSEQKKASRNQNSSNKVANVPSKEVIDFVLCAFKITQLPS